MLSRIARRSAPTFTSLKSTPSRSFSSIPTILFPSKPASYSTAAATADVPSQVFDFDAPTSEKEMAVLARKHLTKGLARVSDHVVKNASGVWIETIEGKKLLDFTSGIGASSTGHCHPDVVAAVTSQVHSIGHAQNGIILHKPLIEVIRKMLPILPKGLDSFWFRTTGSEAIEDAVKVARLATGKQNIIAFQGGFHGRTLGCLSLTTSKNTYRANFGPFMPGVVMAQHPYPAFCSVGKCPESPRKEGEASTCSPSTCTACSEPALDQFELLLKTVTSPSEIAAVIIEPVLGEGGYISASDTFLRGLRDICTRNGILLITDEVQCGMGRTGKVWAFEHSGITPDIVVFAKGVASGYPLAGIVARKEVMDKCPPGSMGGTYAANPVAMAAASATLSIFHHTSLLSNVEARGAQMIELLRNHLPNILEGTGINVDVRGRGLMIGVEFYGDGIKKMKEGGKSIVAEVQKKAVEKDLLILTTSVFETMRLVPALTITESEVNEGIMRFLASVEEVVAAA